MAVLSPTRADKQLNEREPDVKRNKGGIAGRIFQYLSVGAGLTILLTLAAVAVFLVVRAWPALTASPRSSKRSRGSAGARSSGMSGR